MRALRAPLRSDRESDIGDGKGARRARRVTLVTPAVASRSRTLPLRAGLILRGAKQHLGGEKGGLPAPRSGTPAGSASGSIEGREVLRLRPGAIVRLSGRSIGRSRSSPPPAENRQADSDGRCRAADFSGKPRGAGSGRRKIPKRKTNKPVGSDGKAGVSGPEGREFALPGSALYGLSVLPGLRGAPLRFGPDHGVAPDCGCGLPLRCRAKSRSR